MRYGEGLKGAVRMDLEQEVWRALAHARAYMHEASPIVEVDDLAVMLASTRAEVEPALRRLEARGYLLIQMRPGRVLGSAFVTQDGFKAWAEAQLARGAEPLPGFRDCAARIEACLDREPFWATEALAADLDLAVSLLTAQLRVMEALGHVRANKQGSGVILSVSRPG